jgi:hypothetical protein
VRYAAPARLVGRQAVPVPLVSQRHRSRPAASASPLRLVRFPGLTVSSLAGFPASPVQLGRLPSFTVSSSAGFPASPFPVRLVSQLHRFQFGWSSRLAGPGRPVARPPRRHAPPASAKHPRQIPVSRPFPRPGEAPGWCPFLAVNAFLRPPRPSRKSRREFIWTFFRIHMLSTESRRLSAYFSGYPLASAQLIHKSPDVTPRRGAKPICVPQHEGGSHAIVTLPRPAVPGPKRVDGTSVRC